MHACIEISKLHGSTLTIPIKHNRVKTCDLVRSLQSLKGLCSFETTRLAQYKFFSRKEAQAEGATHILGPVLFNIPATMQAQDRGGKCLGLKRPWALCFLASSNGKI